MRGSGEVIANDLMAWGAIAKPIDSKGLLNSVRCHSIAVKKELLPCAVEVWAATCLVQLTPYFETLLDPQEHARAAGFKGEQLRQWFVFAHGLLRLILSAYTGLAPASLRFQQHAYGKPHLSGADHIQFSLSHAGPHVLIAVGTEHAMGVDLEIRRHMPDQDTLVEQFFSQGERHQYGLLPSERREEAFFNMWTRKEALLKGIGLGLMQPLDGFTVSHDSPARVMDGKFQEWTLRHLHINDSLTGALAVCAPKVDLSGGVLDFSGLLG